MPWNSPQPLDRWNERQKTQWSNEVWTRLKFFSFDWTPGTIAASTMVTFTIASAGTPDLLTTSCQGLRQGMWLKLTPPSVPAPGLVWDCAALSDDTVSIWIQNVSGVGVTAPSGTWVIAGVIV